MNWDEIAPDIPEIAQPEIIRGIEQGSDEWFELRLGHITGSTIAGMMAGGNGLTRDKLKIKLAIERMTGKSSTHGFKNAAMKHGNACESVARDHYEFFNDVNIDLVTFIKHPTLAFCGASPDALVDHDGLLEIKCPDTSTHIEYLLTKKIPTNYVLQMQWEMACSGRQWADFISFDPDLPANIKRLTIRVNRDNKKIEEMEKAAVIFIREIDQLINKLESIK